MGERRANSIEFTVNGQKCSVNESLPRDTTLNVYLREVLHLTGTKAMCREGGCGVCIVAVTAVNPASGAVETYSVNSCLVLIFSCHGWDITTVEGVGNRKQGYSIVQKRIAAHNGSQCGYCTPGWVMHMHSLLDKNLTMAELEKSFGSNTCRCTGFRPIIETMKSFGSDAPPEIKDIGDIEDLKLCPKTNKVCEGTCSDDEGDWTFMPHLQRTIELDFGQQKFLKVFAEDEIFDILNKEGYDSYMLVNGNTGKGLLEQFEYPRLLIDVSAVKSLKGYKIDQNLILGANTTIQDALDLFRDLAKNEDGFAYLEEVAKHLELVAHLPVRKIGSLAGNLIMRKKVPSFQSDIFLLLETIGAMVVFQNSSGDRSTLSLLDYLNYDIKKKIMVSIVIPPFGSSRVFRSYKIMPRHQNALAIVNAAFSVELNKVTNILEDVRLCFGNISPKFVHAVKTERFLKSRNPFTNDSLQKAISILNDEIVPDENPLYGSPESRKKVALGLFYKFILNISPKGLVSYGLLSGGDIFQRPVSKSDQDFNSDQSLYPLNKPLVKLAAQTQSAGEAVYVNDLPPIPGQVYAAFVLSTIHKGEIQSVSDDILKTDGVIALLTAKDVPGTNSFSVPGIQLQGYLEEILASENIFFYGQPVAIVVAVSERLAVVSAEKVEVTYKNVSRQAPVLTISQAKQDKSRVKEGEDKIEPKGRGDDVTKIIKGVFDVNSQTHYYMELMSCLVVPVELGLDVYSSTQWIDTEQIAIAKALNMKESELTFKVRRLGGGFGGKISRSAQVSTSCAIVAKTLNRPCRFILPMITNMLAVGKRIVSQTDYEVGVNNDGKIQYLEAKVIEDLGCSYNESILSYVTEGLPNCYNSDYWSVTTADVLTDLPSNTFMRAPGTYEAITTTEHIMEHIAYELKKDPTEVRLANMKTEDNDIPELMEFLKKHTDYNKRKATIEQYNQANRWTKKAIHIAPMLFPVIYYGNYSALVSIYRGDATVSVTTGGVEMGQGLNTKAAQVCAYCLGIPLEKVSVLPNYSFVCANNVFSGSSITTESVCYSIIKGCDMLNERLEPVRKELGGNPSWEDLITKAGEEQIDLTAIYMMNDQEPDLKGYNAYAVNILETQLDVLTGRFEILRVDILEDVGVSANPLLDVGQIEGAFIQGIGSFTSEKLVHDKKTGKLLANRSLTYHVPLALDIPIDFRLLLRYNSKNPKGVLNSKAVGEMGVCTSNAIVHALRRCIMDSRGDSGYDPSEFIDIPLPYDTEAIIQALGVKLEEFVLVEQ